MFLGFDGLGMEEIDSLIHDVSIRRKHSGCRCYFYFATINAFTALQICALGSKPTSPSLEEARQDPHPSSVRQRALLLEWRVATQQQVKMIQQKSALY